MCSWVIRVKAKKFFVSEREGFACADDRVFG